MRTPNPMRQTLLLLGAAALTVPAVAQYDDVYYDPSDFDQPATSTTRSTDESQRDTYSDYDAEAYDQGDDASTYDSDAYASNDEYDAEPFGYDDYSGYEYSSRIRRFRQPYAGFGYYDPVYVDQVYYGGYGRRGFQTALIYDSPYSYSSYARANRFNRWNDPFYDPYYSGFGASSWGRPRYGYGAGFGNGYASGFNQGFGAGYGYGGGGYGYGASSAYYCPPSWGSGYAYNTPAAVPVNSVSARDRAGNRALGTRGTSGRSPSGERPRVESAARTSSAGAPANNQAPSRQTSRRATTSPNGTTAPGRDPVQERQQPANSSRPSRNSTNTTRPSRATGNPDRPSRTQTTPARTSRSTRPNAQSAPRENENTYRQAPVSRPAPSRPAPSRATPDRSYSRPSRSDSPSPSRSSSPSYSAPARSSSPSPSRSSSAPSRSSSRSSRPN